MSSTHSRNFNLRDITNVRTLEQQIVDVCHAEKLHIDHEFYEQQIIYPEVFKHLKDGRYNLMLQRACFIGSKKYAQLAIDIGANNLNFGLNGACLGNQKNLVEFLIDRGVDDFNWGLAGASSNGHLQLAKFLIEKSESILDVNWALFRACGGGHADVVEFLIEKGANDLKSGMNIALEKCRVSIAKLMIEKGARVSCLAMQYACRGGSLDCIQLLFDRNFDTPVIAMANIGLKEACRRGFLHIVKNLIERGADDLNSALENACGYNQQNIVVYLCEQGNLDYDRGYIRACIFGYLNIVKIIVEKGISDYRPGLICACRHACVSIISFLVEKFDIDLHELLNICKTKQYHNDTVKFLESEIEKRH